MSDDTKRPEGEGATGFGAPTGGPSPMVVGEHAQQGPRPQEAQAAQMQYQAALGAGLPHFFANSFLVAMTPADLIVGIIGNNTVACTINMSYIAARTLLDDLSRSLADYEKAVGQPAKSINEVLEGLQRVRGTPNVES